MDKYFITQFYRYIPQIEGMTNITAVDNLNIIKVSSDSVLEQLAAHPDQLSFMEITELEATQATKFYGETRGYRKAYSDSEGLEPDADELANGKRKTKVYITPDLEAATISLMKKAFHFQIDEEMACRQLGEYDLHGNPRPEHSEERRAELKATVDALTTIDEIVEARETILGIEMCKDLAQRKGLWNDERNVRINKVIFDVQF